MEGTIKKLIDKGFGFITPEGEDKDLFFHGNDLVDVEFNNLNEGDKVTFEKEDSDKGPKAVQVTPV
jgi:CspA family cold shock protein